MGGSSPAQVLRGSIRAGSLSRSSTPFWPLWRTLQIGASSGHASWRKSPDLLLEAGFDVVTEAGHSNLVSWRWDGDPKDAAAQLGEQGVLIRDLPGTGLLRASCGYWTSEEDLTRLVSGLRGLAR